MSITAHTDVKVVCQGPLEETPPSVLAALAHGFEQRDVESSKPTHKIRVDFKVGDCLHIFKIILTSVLKMSQLIVDIKQSGRVREVFLEPYFLI